MEEKVGPGSLVVEVASNDGYLLRNFVEAGIEVLGIDPAPDQAAAAEAAGVPTLQEFFGVALAQRLRSEGRRADVIIANNVMAHVPDLNGFVGGIAELLTDDGVATIENPYVRDLIDHCEFDTIYHEHHCYFSCTAIDILMRRNGLFLNDVEYFPSLHGGTLRWYVGRHEDVSPAVVAIPTGRPVPSGQIEVCATAQLFADEGARVAAVDVARTGVDAVVGVDDLQRIPDIVTKALDHPCGEPVVAVSSDLPTHLFASKIPAMVLTGGPYAYLKIAEDCQHVCAFCAIPGIRGKLRSRTIDDVVAEAKAILAEGIRELDIIAQDVTSYGSDLKDGTSLAKLLRRLDALKGDFWIRLLYGLSLIHI